VFVPLLAPARYKGAYGGRSSGKTHFFGGALIERCIMQPTRWVCLREVQKDLKDSVRQVLLDKMEAHGVRQYFDVVQSEIRGPNGSLISFRGMNDYTADSIKSLEGYDGAWFAEAQRASKRSLQLLRPTIRKDGSELWFDWNPENAEDPVDRMFRGAVPLRNSIAVEAKWSDNPWLPSAMLEEMQTDYDTDAELAEHIWGGGYRQAPSGAYYALLLAQARQAGRIGNVEYDPILDVDVSWDLGNGPNMAAWFTQRVRREVRVIDFLQGDEEAAGIGWPWYIKRLREKPYTYGNMILPHDARSRQRVNGKGDEQTLREAKFKTRVVPKMDPGEGVKLVQRFLGRCWFDEAACAPGLKALKHYQMDWDDKLKIDRGPLHNWASHPADAFRHMVQAYVEPPEKKPEAEKDEFGGTGRGSWLG
jgi:phage terminase large subunit